MKKLYFLFTLLISTITFSQNLAINGDFESFTTGVLDTWTNDSGITIEEETTIISEGAKSGKFTITTQNQADTDLRQTINVVAGTTYDVSVDIYALDNGARARFFVETYQNYSDDTTLNQWQTLTYTYTATTSGPIDIGFRFYDTSANWTGSSIMYIDNFQFVAQLTPSLAITSPTDGSTTPDTNIDIAFSVQNFAVANPGSGDGHISYTVDNGSATDKFDTSVISLTSLSTGVHTIYMELVDDSGTPISPAVNSTVNFTVSPFTVVNNLAALRADVIANGDGLFYEISSEAIVTYTRAARNQKYIQDGTAAILIDDNTGIILNTFNEGDGMTGLKGQAIIFSGVLQLIPYENITASSTGNTITPEVVTISDITGNIEAYESELVQINGVTFINGDGVATFAVSTNYDISDGSTMIFRTLFAEANYVANANLIPSGANDMAVIVTEFNGTPQVVARSLADVTLSTNSFNAIEGLTMYPNPVSGNVLHFSSTANANMSVQIFDIVGKEVINAKVINNTINTANLNAGMYIVKITEEGKTATRKLVVK
ncbi:T9SS type A sorting domain-containing protein [Flavobacterium sediminilitoris]|uniref:T9SS type A sorting domain-containing protein n=1 Tax=Flavobacterium sediminilitoris TaxID=2024526 RepID=A0ABY4HRA5_9FLAO|nr:MULTISPECIES: T9SS type A sorting domain-containing protein [Flavobacterium]UOX35238.1 T9SS type A sorting domain-containing protein [Flavobacterium sediminilitoris]